MLRKKLRSLTDNAIEALLKETIERVRLNPSKINKSNGMMIYNLLGEELSKRYSGVFDFDDSDNSFRKNIPNLWVVK